MTLRGATPMALDEFWQNVKIAASQIWPTVRAPQLDENQLAGILRKAALWLTPLSVEGFDLNDFGFLPSSERVKLKKSVADFLRVSKTVPDRVIPTDLQYREALESLRRILDILQPDKYPDADAFRTAKVLENLDDLRLSDDVRGDVNRIIYQFDIDSTGDPATWVWVILNDEAARRTTLRQDKDRIARSIEAALRRQRIPLRPHIHFRTFSEQDDVDRGRLR